MNSFQLRNLPERTGYHHCTRCLADVDREEYFANDHQCARCAADDSFPNASDVHHEQYVPADRLAKESA
jgi:hypothetical protein